MFQVLYLFINDNAYIIINQYATTTTTKQEEKIWQEYTNMGLEIKIVALTSGTTSNVAVST